MRHPLPPQRKFEIDFIRHQINLLINKRYNNLGGLEEDQQEKIEKTCHINSLNRNWFMHGTGISAVLSFLLSLINKVYLFVIKLT